MELHEFMCPQVFPQTAQLRDAPARLAAYADSLLMLCDFERDRLVFTSAAPDAGQPLTLTQVPANPPTFDPASFEALAQGQRSVALIDQMRALGARWFLGNMRDAVPFSPKLYFGHPANILQYNRRRHDRTGVLWRLPGYFEPSEKLGCIGRDQRLVDERRFLDKRPQVVWRGNCTGRQWLTPWTYRQFDVVYDEAALRQSEPWQPRARAVCLSLEMPEQFDCKFRIPPRKWRQRDPEAPLGPIADRTRSPDWLLRFRYQLCLPGNDVATQLYWIIGSNSLALKVESDYDVLPDYFLEPWVHYVPVAWDLSDLPDKLDYLEANPDLCHAIIARANVAYEAILDAQVWEAAELTVLDRLGLLAD